ncbi:MAG: hypothetical protein ACKN9T_11085 [Candidatus Methylumidiphilus sp.]
MAADSESFDFPHTLGFYSTCHPCANNGRIRPLFADRTIYTTIAGAETAGLDFSAYDVLVLSAAGLLAYRNNNSHLMFEIRLPRWETMPGGNIPMPTVVSSGLFGTVIAETLMRSWAIQMCRVLSSAFEGQIIVQPWPLPSASILQDNNWNIRILYGERAAEISSYFYALQYQKMLAIFSEIDNDIIVLDYPNHNWLDHGFTPSAYGTGDPWHMNINYGSLVMAQIAKALSSYAA